MASTSPPKAAADSVVETSREEAMATAGTVAESTPTEASHPSAFLENLRSKRFVVGRQTVSEQLFSNMDLIAASPRPRIARNAAHAEVSEDFGQPQLPCGSGRRGGSSHPQAVVTDRSPYASSPKRAAFFADELSVATPGASTATPVTLGSMRSTPESRTLRGNADVSRTASFGVGAATFGSPSSRLALAELELLVAEVEGEVQGLETSCSRPLMGNSPGRPCFGFGCNPEELSRRAMSCRGQLKSAAQRARALEPDVLPSEKLQLAHLRSALAEKQLRFERWLSSLSSGVSEAEAPLQERPEPPLVPKALQESSGASDASPPGSPTSPPRCPPEDRPLSASEERLGVLPGFKRHLYAAAAKRLGEDPGSKPGQSTKEVQFAVPNKPADVETLRTSG
ncbi:unnamed protein product [Symbiodinium sp. CCMP2592]|nr:unnamed protein product [Symbiodinium sp. CCMP2592]